MIETAYYDNNNMMHLQCVRLRNLPNSHFPRDCNKANIIYYYNIAFYFLFKTHNNNSNDIIYYCLSIRCAESLTCSEMRARDFFRRQNIFLLFFVVLSLFVCYCLHQCLLRHSRGYYLHEMRQEILFLRISYIRSSSDTYMNYDNIILTI